MLKKLSKLVLQIGKIIAAFYLGVAVWASKGNTPQDKIFRAIVLLLLISAPFIVIFHRPSSNPVPQPTVQPSTYNPQPSPSPLNTPEVKSDPQIKEKVNKEPDLVEKEEFNSPSYIAPPPNIEEVSPPIQYQTRGNCVYPDDVDSRGRRCGKRASSVRPGGN